MAYTPAEWHARFTVQARWTSQVREYYFSKLPIHERSAILEVGCGTGALFEDMQKYLSPGKIVGLDFNPGNLRFAIGHNHFFLPVLGDAYTLPLRSGHFDIAYCHYFLLWITDPLQVMAEIVRILKPGGIFVALAEPDYEGRIDYPDELIHLGKLQNASLMRQGARLDAGRKLPALFSQAGMEHIEVGILGGQWDMMKASVDRISEWEMLQHDLQEINNQEMEDFHLIDNQAWDQRKRVLFVPTFFASGYKPDLTKSPSNHLR
jgi:SAM-dependent methyltransferase